MLLSSPESRALGRDKNLTISNKSDLEIARQFVLATAPNVESYDATTLKMTTDLVLSKPTLLAQAKAFDQLESQTFELSNTGINKYFWFIPEGKSDYVPGRILDINRYADFHMNTLTFNDRMKLEFTVEAIFVSEDELSQTRKVLLLTKMNLELLLMISIKNHVKMQLIFF